MSIHRPCCRANKADGVWSSPIDHPAEDGHQAPRISFVLQTVNCYPKQVLQLLLHHVYHCTRCVAGAPTARNKMQILPLDRLDLQQWLYPHITLPSKALSRPQSIPLTRACMCLQCLTCVSQAQHVWACKWARVALTGPCAWLKKVMLHEHKCLNLSKLSLS